jgi:hypothetical protein
MFRFNGDGIMGRRLDFEKASRNHQAKYGLSVKDDGEWMENDAAANWLRKNKSRAFRKGDHRLPAQQPACSGMRRHRRKHLKRTHADLDPFDPHDQLADIPDRLVLGCKRRHFAGPSGDMKKCPLTTGGIDPLPMSQKAPAGEGGHL